MIGKSAVTLLLLGLCLCSADELNALKAQVKELSDKLETVSVRHATHTKELKNQIEQLRSEQRNGWTHTAVVEMQDEMRHIISIINSSIVIRKLHEMDNMVRKAFAETKGLSKQADNDRKILEANAMVLSQVRQEAQMLRNAGHEMKTKEIHMTKQITEIKYALNSTIEKVKELRRPSPSITTRHSKGSCILKFIRKRISDVTKRQRKMGVVQESFQLQLSEAQNYFGLCAKLSDTTVVAARADILELENRIQAAQIKNLTADVSDISKLHLAVLELRENVESMETKVDNSLPEYRAEISKLDINMAQVNSQISYNREDQENLRQSVKAIAFSVSNSMDKAVVDRRLLHHLNASVGALEQLSKQHSYRLYDHILKSEANHTDNDTTYDPFVALPELMGEVKDLQPAHKEYEELVRQLPRDCSTVAGPPGVYLIAPGFKPVEVWCNNGSTLLQRRFNGSVEFNVKFADYVKPIGRPETEFWIGLENMYRLTADNCSTMCIKMVDIYGGSWYANYDQFSVGPADGGYKLFVGGFKGNASDAFEYQNRMEFSAIDRDRDISNTHCAGNYEGGWWFSHCQHVNINGRYALGLTWFNSVKNEWIAVASSEMTLSRNASCM